MKSISNSSVKKVFLHVGLHKTGTSSIQHTMWHNQDRLRSEGIFVPKTWKRNHGIVLNTMFSDQANWQLNTKNVYYVNNHLNSIPAIESFVQKNKNNFELEIKEMACETVLFSGEDISKMDEISLGRLSEGISTWFPNASIEILIYVRERSAYASSFYQQEIKAGKPIEPLIFENLFEKSIEKFVTVFSKDHVKVAKFEESLQDVYGPVGFFFRLLDLNSDQIESLSLKRANQGISAKAIELVNYVNFQLPILDGNHYRKGRVYRDTHHFHQIKGEKFKFDEKFVKEIIEAGVSDTNWLWENFGIDYRDQVIDFSQKKQALVYDEDYYDDMIICYKNLTCVLKKLVYQFLLEKQKSELTYQNSITVNRLIDWIEHETLWIKNSSLTTIIKKFERQQFVNKVKNKIEVVCKKVFSRKLL